MEDYDDLSAGPDDDGRLNLSYNSWREMPPELFQYASSLVSLDLRHNRLVEISADFGVLLVLRELNASNNCIEKIDPLLGKCVRLRDLDVSHNRLTQLPTELTKCLMLESFKCINNQITSVPKELGNLHALTTIELENNNLTEIPVGLSLIPTLKRVSCVGNEGLRTVPDGMRQSSDLVIWCLRLQQNYTEKVASKLLVYENAESHVRCRGERRLRLLESLDRAENEVRELEGARPEKYIKFKIKLVKATRMFSFALRSVCGKRDTVTEEG